MNETSKDARDAIEDARDTIGDARDAIGGGPRGSLTIATLGGVAEIGMNFTLYGMDGRYVLVDAGTGFAPRECREVEVLMPDPSILTDLGPSLEALCITHAHEDHIGAIHRLFPRFLDCPIHAPPFAARLVAARLQERGVRGKVDLRTFEVGAAFEAGPFRFESVQVAHSTPDCVAFSITPAQSAATRPARWGRVVHSGDWKDDPKPGVGGPTDFGRFEALGAKGCDLFLCDSTGAVKEAPRTSEDSVRRAMTSLMAKARGAVFVASFGSNVARMASVAHAAKATQRKVALAGRSLRQAADIGQALGHLAGVPEMLPETRHLAGTQRRGHVVLCTGTQGEEDAALARLAEGRDKRLPRVLPGDVVVHSARAIPGNEPYIEEVLAKLRKRGARIVTAEDRFDGHAVHVTGHPCREDLRRMYGALRPAIAMPVHGTPEHLAAHARLAVELGVPRAMAPTQRGVYRLCDGDLSQVGAIARPEVAVLADSQSTIVPWDPATGRPVLDAEAAAALAHAANHDPKMARRLATGPKAKGADGVRPGTDDAPKGRDGRKPHHDQGPREGRQRQGRRGARRADRGDQRQGKEAAREGGRAHNGAMAGRDRAGTFVTERRDAPRRPPEAATAETVRPPPGGLALDRAFISSLNAR